MYKVAEELLVTVATSFPYCALTFYLVALQGSVALFWLTYLVTSSVGVGVCVWAATISSFFFFLRSFFLLSF